MFVIFGTGGCGRELLRQAQDMLGLLSRSDIAFASDDPRGDVLGVETLSVDDLTGEHEAVIAIGDPQLRKAIAERLKCRFASLAAPSAIIDPSAEIGEGAVICDLSFIGSQTKIGRHFQCNVRSHVHHDCVIGDYVTFSPGTLCLGTVHIGDGVFVGAGAILRNGSAAKPLLIGAGAIVGMGAVVTKNVPPGVTVMGNPAHT